jgi:hypothetical protein
VNEIASYFDDMYCKGELMKYGTMRITSPIDRLHINACPEGLNGITYCYSSRKEISFLGKEFGIYIDNALCDNFDLLMDTCSHELMHAKMHIEGISDLNDHGPKFLEIYSMVCKGYLDTWSNATWSNATWSNATWSNGHLVERAT